MSENDESEPCCDDTVSCCEAEAIIKIDERGQMVFPKDLRQKAGIKAGDKFVVVSIKKDDKISFFSLIKADEFSGMVEGFLGPIMADVGT
jgi:AbrB family looped-hinge helix DNA binding protein